MRIFLPALACLLTAPCMVQRPTLYELARVLRDRAGCADALFLDGNDAAMLRVGGGAVEGEAELVGFIGVFAR